MAETKNKTAIEQLIEQYHKAVNQKAANRDRLKFLDGVTFMQHRMVLESLVEAYPRLEELQRVEILAEAKKIYEQAELIAKKYGTVNLLQQHFNLYEQLKEFSGEELQ